VYDEELAQAVKILCDRSTPLEMSVQLGHDDPDLQRSLTSIARRLEEKGGGGVVAVEGGFDPPSAPALSFRFRGGGTVHYLTVPSGPEAVPFLELLSLEGGPEVRGAEPWRTALDEMDRPAELLVFVTSLCPHCPGAVRSASLLAVTSSKVTVAVLDAERFTRLAGEHAVLSVPLTVIDGALRITEVIPPEKLASRLLDRGSQDYESSVFRSFLAAGDVDGASRRLLEHRDNALSFVEAWRESTLSSRMALMLVSESALERDPQSLDAAVPGLIELLGSGDDPLRGDSADLLGQIGHGGAIGPLEKLLSEPNPDLVEIAEEALEKLKGGEP
jgi:hypothetical protein